MWKGIFAFIVTLAIGIGSSSIWNIVPERTVVSDEVQRTLPETTTTQQIPANTVGLEKTNVTLGDPDGTTIPPETYFWIDQVWTVRILTVSEPSGEVNWSKRQVLLCKDEGFQQSGGVRARMCQEYLIRDPVLQQRYGKRAAAHLKRFGKQYTLVF